MKRELRKMIELYKRSHSHSARDVLEKFARGQLTRIQAEERLNISDTSTLNQIESMLK